MAAAGLTAEFRSLVLAGREATRILSRDGTVLLDEPDDGTGGRPEVQRGELRRILVEEGDESETEVTRDDIRRGIYTRVDELPADLGLLTAHLDALAAIARWHAHPADARLKAEVDERRRALRADHPA